ncbi:Arfaptin-like domain protein [Necator americanus]|uniref:Arfaptin-like domain protein n=1 Tax=Necator americanus TaxID=51031 RepID=W2SMK1_NECAM|nr:Arfaptin-like domain protein [Necator americanus]ETN70096.1 Arfaptin-like domain protein [Necator americanus]
MATRHYESNTSGMNIDRFLDKFDESTLVTMKRHYWTAKQLLRTKLGKKEDEHLLASDASLDSKLTLFRSVRDTSENLLASVENYQAFLLDAILCENELGKYLKEQGKNDKREETGRMMVALGRAMLFSSHQRAAVRVPLIRFYQELHVFAERAIFDCSQTVDAVERARLEYRGSLLWMKKTSEELDPDTDRQLEKFREAQSAVRLNKEKLDKLKVDTLQKVDLLSASRSNLLSHLLGKYLQMLCAYYEKTCRAYTALSANLSTFQHYEFEILTDLIEPSKKVAKKLRQESMDKEKKEYSQLPAVEPEEEAVGNLVDFDEEPAGSLKKYLFGRESPADENNQEPEEERPESPLGVPENEPDAKKIETEQLNKIYIGPLPTLIDTEAEVPLLAPPPRAVPFQTQPSCSASKPFSLLTDTSGYSVQDLFPLVEKKKQDSDQGSIVDLLGAPSSQFPNPFEENKTTEWDLLLSQCDIQQSNDLI